MDLFEPKISFSFSKKVSINEEIRVISDEEDNPEVEKNLEERVLNDESIEEYNSKSLEKHTNFKEPEDFFFNVHDKKKVEINVSEFDDFIDDLYSNGILKLLNFFNFE